MYIDKKGNESAVTVWLVFIAPKQSSYPRKYKDYDCGDREYIGLVELLNKEFDESKPDTHPYFFLDIDDYVFEPLDHELNPQDLESVRAIRQSSQDLSSKLRKLGMTYNKALDPLLKDWIAEKKRANLEASGIPVKRGRKPSPGSQMNFRTTGS